MTDTIGSKIGIVRHSCKVSQYKGGPSTSFTISIDFTTASDADITSWLCSNRIIAGQRPWRGLSEEELADLDGKVFIAQNIGQKVKSRADQIQALVNAGLPETLATFAVDNPTKFQETVKDIDTSNDVEEDEDSDELDD